MQIDSIYLVVHPLFRQAQMKDSKERRAVTQNEMDNYGRMILEAKKNANSLIIFVPTTTKNPETRKKQARLIKFARKTLGKRVISLSTEFGFREHRRLKDMVDSRPEDTQRIQAAIKEATKKLSQFEFTKKPTIISSGQFLGQCVMNGSFNLEYILKLRGSKPNISFQKESKTLSDTVVLLGKNRSMIAFRKWRQKTFGKKAKKHLS